MKACENIWGIVQLSCQVPPNPGDTCSLATHCRMEGSGLLVCLYSAGKQDAQEALSDALPTCPF